MGKDRSIVPYWGTYPTNRVRGSYGFPKTETVPLEAGHSPSTAFRRVDFPPPFGPTIPTSSP
jgi:hypothetical protein